MKDAWRAGFALLAFVLVCVFFYMCWLQAHAPFSPSSMAAYLAPLRHLPRTEEMPLVFGVMGLCMLLSLAAVGMQQRWIAGVALLISAVPLLYWVAAITAAGAWIRMLLFCWLPFATSGVLVIQLYVDGMFERMDREIVAMYEKYKFDSKTA